MLIKLFIKRTNLFLLSIIMLPIILNIIWFRNGNFMGVAESGLPFYNFQLAYEANQTTWNNYALGFPTNIGIAAEPTYRFMAWLQNLGIPSFILQAAFFHIVLVISGISIYYITKNLFPHLDKRYLYIAALFYWFNPFSMVDVWNRFLNNFFVFYMLLPLAFLLFLKGLQTRKYYYSFLIGLISVVLSYALTSVAFNILLWLVLFYTAGFYIIILQTAKERFFVIKYLFLTLLFWCLANLWWISQIFSYVYSGSFLAVAQTSFSPANNQQIFTILSQKLGYLINILRFQHSSFFNSTSDIPWVDLYIFPPIAYFSFILPLIIFLPLVVVRRNVSVLFISGLMILGIFLSKGNNPPFGELLNLIFTKVGSFQALRNAFEKFGFILPLAGAPLFSLGVYILSEKIPKWRNIVYLFTLSWLMIIFGLPYWTGLVFTNNELPTSIPQIGYQVQVPDYYKRASNWLNNQPGNFRLLVLPTGGEGITYNWEKGYTGVELSNQLLPITSVSFQTNVPFYKNISGDLEKAFMTKGDFTKIADLLNAKYIMARNDIDWHARRMRDPQSIFNRLKENEQFKIVANFGALTFWENLNFVDRKIYSSSNAISILPQPNMSDTQFLPDNAVLLEDSIQLKDEMINQYILHPIVKFSLGANLSQISITGQDIFPHIRFSPETQLYNLILIKEQFELNTTTFIPNKISLGIKLLGKRLVEAKSAADSNKNNSVLIAIENYEKLLKTTSSYFPEYSSLDSDFDKQLSNQEVFYNIFHEHKKIFADLINYFSANQSVSEKLQSTQKLLDSTLINIQVQPNFGFKEEDSFPIKNRVVYKFNVKSPGDYELLWGDSSLDKYYKKGVDDRIILQIDDQLVSVKTSYKESGLRSFGKIYFNSGVHEISMNTEEGINLLDAPKEINLKVKHGVTKKTFPIKNYDSLAEYTISLDYWVKTGSGAAVSIEANNARMNLGEIDPDYSKALGPDNYDFREKHFLDSFKLTESVDAANLIFKVKPWNDCESIFFTKGKKRCKDESFRYPYDRTTEVIIKNISVIRNLIDEPILVKSGLPLSNIQPSVKFKKIKNTEYLVTINNAVKPYILFFSDLFDPGWKIFTPNGDELRAKHFLVNAYANGWEIDKLGDYELLLKYAPQDLLGPTKKISQAAFIFGFLMVSWKLWSKNVTNN